MAVKDTEYLGLPALLLQDRSLNISLIVTAIRAQLIVDHMAEIQNFAESNRDNIDEEQEARAFARDERRRDGFGF